MGPTGWLNRERGKEAEKRCSRELGGETLFSASQPLNFA